MIMVGRLTSPKRFDVFLRVLSRLRDRGEKKMVGHIVGDGPDRQSIEYQAQALGLDATCLRFHGSVVDVVPLYQEAHVCLHLSDWEGMPNTILEAMACGLPIIASPVGGVPELVQNGITGFLVDTHDEQCLTDAVQELYENHSLRLEMGIGSRRFIEENHTLEKLRASIANFYGYVLANSRESMTTKMNDFV
jgi:glycosyltransferase involved in cell wall biosynthesis